MDKRDRARGPEAPSREASSAPPDPSRPVNWNAYLKAGLAPQYKAGTAPPDLLSRLPPPIVERVK